LVERWRRVRPAALRRRNQSGCRFRSFTDVTIVCNGQLQPFAIAAEIPHTDQMRLIDALCRFIEIAKEQAAAQGASH
jgi:hypothetical protein